MTISQDCNLNFPPWIWTYLTKKVQGKNMSDSRTEYKLQVVRSEEYMYFWRALEKHVDTSARGWQAELSLALDLSPSYISKVYNTYKKQGKVRGLEVKIFGAETQEKLAKKFGYESRQDMINAGKPAEKFIQEMQKYVADNQAERVVDHSDAAKNFEVVPLIKAKVCAGGGSYETSTIIDKFLSFRTDWLMQKGNINNLVTLKVMGDSMEPTILHEDVVLIDESYKNIINNKIYAVAHEKEILIKRIIKNKDGINLIPDNLDFYAPEMVQENDYFEIIGRVVWLGREL